MKSTQQVDGGSTPSERWSVGLEELIPIAVVISAGCERCAESLVRRALERGCARSLIGRTLGVVQYVGSAECLLHAVGPDVIARLEKALRVAGRTLSEASPSHEARNRGG